LLGIVLNRTEIDKRSYYGYYAETKESHAPAAG